jgi:hypothetical protein
MIETAIIIDRMDEASRLIQWSRKYTLPVHNGTLITFATATPYTPTKGDKLWFYPGCEIPRFKVKQFCVKHDVSVVKYKDKSSVRFMGPESIKELIESYNGRATTKDIFLQWLDTVMCNAYVPLRDAIVATQSAFVFIKGGALGSFCKKDLFGTKVLFPRTDEAPYHSIDYIKDDENYQQLTDMMSDVNLRSQDDLLSLLNTGVEMDQKMYDDIHRLFESSDKENTKLAMEAMANCDFQKSAVYLLLLLKEYGQKMSDSGNKHHVNFKSLIKYFQIRNLENMSVDSMIDSLRHQKLLSVDNLNRLMPLAMETIKKEGDMRNIKIKDVELSTEAEISVAENILDQQNAPPTPPVPGNPDSESHAALFAQTSEQELGTL